ncbi:MAG: molybdenum cofactor biosynthesis protein MoaE [Actinomycetaceae bacterium]|nr:molybdenum cofactor biosynthesis protein MoaE [Actinomycetaceae bacterium]
MKAHGRVRLASVQEQDFDVEGISSLVNAQTSGALITFEGRIRNHDSGRGVTGIEYSAHPDAEGVLREIAEGVCARHPDCLVAVAHRVGILTVGDLAMCVAVSSAHRSQAFVAIQDLIDTVKAQLPVWKRQVFVDGSDEWVGLP